MLKDIPNLTDAFCGTSLVLHVEGEGELDLDAVRKVLKEKKIKTKGEISKDATKLLS